MHQKYKQPVTSENLIKSTIKIINEANIIWEYVAKQKSRDT